MSVFRSMNPTPTRKLKTSLGMGPLPTQCVLRRPSLEQVLCKLLAWSQCLHSSSSGPCGPGQDRGALSDAMGKMDGAETGRGMHSLKSFGVTTQVRGSISPVKLDGQSSTVALKRGVGGWTMTDNQAEVTGPASSLMPLASFY